MGRIGINNAVPNVDLDVSGAARITSGETTSTALTTTGRVGVNQATPTVALDVTGYVKVSSTLITGGNIGIGIATAVPTAPLDVSGAAKISTVVSAGTGIIIGDNTQSTMTTDSELDIRDTTSARMRFTGAGKRFTLGVHLGESYVWNEDSHDMAFGTSGTQRMKIKADGKIGIGTNMPGAELEVVGRIYANNTSSSNQAIVTNGRVGINIVPEVDLHVAGQAKITGNLDMSITGRITSLADPTSSKDAATKSYVDNSIPVGGIIMWSGTSGTTLPNNWKLCDGSSYNNNSITTPDLRGRFVLSSTTPISAIGNIALASGLSSRTVGANGGLETVTLTIDQIPGHRHDVSGSSDIKSTTHSHTITDTGHTHNTNLSPGSVQDLGPGTFGPNPSAYQPLQSPNTAWVMETSNKTTGITGTDNSVQSHNHNITITENSKGGGLLHENMPPFYVLAFIMRIS